MATNPNVTLKRHNGTDIDIIYPKTRWAQVLDIPSTFTPTAHTHGNADLTGILSAQKVTATAVSTTTPASIVGINLEANAYYQIEIYGTWSKVANGTANAPVFTIAVNNTTGTPFWSGVFEWFAAPTNSVMVYESNAANITSTTTTLGFQIASSTSAFTATHFAMRGNLYTGTSTKTLTLYIANTASTNPVTCDRAYIMAVRLS